MTPADLARLTDEERRSVELAEGASPGPWSVSAGDEHLIMEAGPRGEYVCCVEGALSNPQVIADRQHICDARTAVPHFAAEVARLRGELEGSREIHRGALATAVAMHDRLKERYDARDAAIRAFIEAWDIWAAAKFYMGEEEAFANVQALRALVTPKQE